MEKQDLIPLSPVRIFDEASEGGLKKGEMGLITAKKGLGKTSVLVQFGIDSLLKNEHVVHVSFDQHSSNVIAWYDSILSEIARKKHIEISEITGDIVRERTILNFNQETFNLSKVVNTIKALKDSGINISSLVVDGFDLDKAEVEDIKTIASFVKENGMTAWFSLTSEAETLEKTLDSNKLDFFANVAHLVTKEKDLCMAVFKPVSATIVLDPKTTLMTK